MSYVPYEQILGSQYYYRVEDSSSRTAYNPVRGIQAPDIHNKPFVDEPMTRVPGDIPFPGITATDITSHPRVWKQPVWRNSKLISVTDNLMWDIWDSVRRLSKVRYNACNITLYVIRKPESDDQEFDAIVASACDIFSKITHEHVWEASNFSRSSSEHFYFLRIPARYIEYKMTFNPRVSIPDHVVNMKLTTPATP